MLSSGTISLEDLDLFRLVDEPHEVVDAIFDYYKDKDMDTYADREKHLEL